MSRSTLVGFAALLVLPAIASAQGSNSCSSAQAITGTGTFAFDTTAATTDGVPDPLCNAFGESNIANDVWFAWTAPSTGLATVTTCALTTIDSRIAVIDGSCAGPVLACNDDACASLQSSLDVNVTAGHLYLLRVGNFPGASPGTGSISVQFPGLLGVADTRVNPANGHTYHLLTGGSWTAAEATAVSLGGHLATVNDLAEHDWIKQQWHQYQATYRDLWIGFNDAASEGTFVWADGTPVGYTNWDPSAPDDPNGSEDYVALRKNDPVSAFWIDLADAPTGFHANPLGVVEISGTTGTLMCFGDGSGASCPCGNDSTPGAGEGCRSSLGIGGRLTAAGSASIAGDTLVLQGTQMPNAPCLYFQGTSASAGGAGIAFGDGLRCAGGTIVRLGPETNSGGASQYPGTGDPSVSVRGMCSAGDVRHYQIWYRNAAAFCTPSTFNLTNGSQVAWGA